MAEIDKTRTVPARLVDVFRPGGSAPNGIDAEPGDCQPRGPYPGENVERLAFACPGCGRWGSIAVGTPKPTDGVDGTKVSGPTWDIIQGDTADPTGLTLHPSIHCVGCCDWHGYLTNGVFKSC